MSPRSSTSTGSSSLADGQERREEAHVLLEEVEDRGDPALAEPDAGAHALHLQLLRPSVGGLLEESDARLAPELAAEEERRVRRHGDLRAGDRLGRVPVAREALGLGLEVQLDARAGRLGGDRVGEGGEALDAGDRDLEVLAASGEDLLVEVAVAGLALNTSAVRCCSPTVGRMPMIIMCAPDGARALLGAVEAEADRLLELA